MWRGLQPAEVSPRKGYNPQPDSCVADVQVALHGRHQQPQDLAIDEREGVAKHQNENDGPGITERYGAVGSQKARVRIGCNGVWIL